MKRALLVAAVLLSACGEGNSPLPTLSPEPTGPSTSLSAGGGVFVIGQTIGPNGEIYQVTGTYNSCGSEQRTIKWQGNYTVVTMGYKCASTSLSSWDAKIYDGGIVNVLVQSDDGFTALGWVPANLEKEGNFFDVPAGAAVRLQASLNPGCELSYWNTDTGQTFNGNPLDIPANSNIGYVEATFYCSS